MKVVWFTDLDRTLIHSKYFLNDEYKGNPVCVEYKDGEPLSYMEDKGEKLLKELLNNDNLLVVPVTARSIEQYNRIIPFQEHKGYAITSNGGHIIHNNVIDEEWHNNLLNKIEDCDFNELVKTLNGKYSEYLRKPFRLVDDTCIYAVIDGDKYKDAIKLFESDTLINSNNLYTTIQASKVYINHREATKEIAVKKFIEKIKSEYEDAYIIASGDGLLDKGFVSLADLKIAPKGTPLAMNLENVTIVSDGILGAVEMMLMINKIAKGEKH